jgi:hypothetical protein
MPFPFLVFEISISTVLAFCQAVLRTVLKLKLGAMHADVHDGEGPRSWNAPLTESGCPTCSEENVPTVIIRFRSFIVIHAIIYSNIGIVIHNAINNTNMRLLRMRERPFGNHCTVLHSICLSRRDNRQCQQAKRMSVCSVISKYAYEGPGPPPNAASASSSSASRIFWD